MKPFSQSTFHRIFSSPQEGAKEKSSALSSEDRLCIELNDNKQPVYENMPEEDLFLEALEEYFIPHIPPFNFEQKNESVYVLTMLLPGVDKKDVNILLVGKKLAVRICSFRKQVAKEKPKKVLHKGIFDILMPGIPFESIFEMPFSVHLKDYDLSEGILKLTFEKKRAAISETI